MIRIDEIYNNTFWPFIKQYIPSTRMLYFDPNEADSLAVYKSNRLEFNYIFFHDRNTIESNIHTGLFDTIINKNLDCLNNSCVTGRNTTLEEFLKGPKLIRPHYRVIITSEQNSVHLEQVKEKYGWTSYYYFHHGWVALDHYRGHNRNFNIIDPEYRIVSATDPIVHTVNELVTTGQRHFLTTKTFEPICTQLPFVLKSTAGSLKYLRSYGFQTFSSLWDESYDDEVDDLERQNKIDALVAQLNILSAEEKQAMFDAALPIIKHNHNHFYNGNFEKILWTEFKGMLDTLAQDLNPIRINFCYDTIINGRGYPNLAKWKAEPYTKEWREFDAHWPRTVPLRLTMYLDYAGISYGTYTVNDAPDGSWYPIAIGWFDFDCDYVSMLSETTKERVRKKEIKLLFYYHEGDNPMRIRSRIGKLCWANNLPSSCFKFVSANSAANSIDECLYFQEHELFFRYVNRKQQPTQATPTYTFTMLNRTHKWWRASCVVDLLKNGVLKDSLWSYDTTCDIGEDPRNNPIELESEPGWRKDVEKFVANGPYPCDELSSTQQNDHHWVNEELYRKSFFHIITETHFDADQSGGTFITEKTWKCIKYGQPFVIVGPVGTLKALRESGYKVFDNVLDNSYDTIENNTKRWAAIRNLLISIQQQGPELYKQCLADVEWNQKIFADRQIPPVNNLLEKLTWQT